MRITGRYFSVNADFVRYLQYIPLVILQEIGINYVNDNKAGQVDNHYFR